MLSMSQLAEITGFDRRTVKARLSGIKAQNGPKGALIYDSTVALPILYAQDAESDLERQILQENLRKERAEAEIREMKASSLRKELVPIEDVATVVEKEYAAVRAAMLALPSKVSQEIASMDDVLKIKILLEDNVNEALAELSADTRFAEGEMPQVTGEEEDEPGVEGSTERQSSEDP